MDEDAAGYKGTGDVEAGGVEAREGVWGARVESLEAEELGSRVGGDGASWGMLVGRGGGEMRGGMKREGEGGKGKVAYSCCLCRRRGWRQAEGPSTRSWTAS